MAMVKIGKTKRREDYSAAFVVGAVIGGLAGALAVLWTTPKTGQEIREQLAGSIPAMPSLGGSTTLDFGTTPASVTHERPADVKAPGEASGEPTSQGIGHVATTEELVTPPTPAEQAEIRANAEAILNDRQPS